MATAVVDLSGQTLLGKYEIVSLIGVGGMGEVWLAQHTLTGRRLAIKVLDPGYAKHEKVVARFEREARAASAVDHAGVVEVLDIDQTDDGVPFMVMEYLEGETLSSRIESRGRLREDEVVYIGGLLLDALAAAHAEGVVHRDLKPDNIFLVSAGRGGEAIKILDFGISRMVEQKAQKLTVTGSVLGTPHYMSPEQAMGDMEVDHRTDLYAAGVVLYECAVGDVPFDAPNYNKLLRIILDEEAPLPRSRGAQISAELECLITWAMEKERDLRIRSAAEMAQWLERAAAGEMPPYTKALPKATPAGLRPVGSLPANRAVASSLDTPAPEGRRAAESDSLLDLDAVPTPTATDGWRPSDVPPAAPDRDDAPIWTGGAGDLPEIPSAAPVPDLAPLPSLDSALMDEPSSLELELDEGALRSSQPARVSAATEAVRVRATALETSVAQTAQPRSSSESVVRTRARLPETRAITGSHSAVAEPPDPNERRQGPAWRRFALPVGLAVVVAVGLFFAAQRDGAPEQAESLPAATPSPVVRPERPVRPARRRPEVARWITVTVVGLPPESEVLLDGLPASSPLRLRRDSEHVLEVRAPGYDPATLELETAHDHTVNPELRPSSDPG